MFFKSINPESNLKKLREKEKKKKRFADLEY